MDSFFKFGEDAQNSRDSPPPILVILAPCLQATVFRILTLDLNNSLDYTPKTYEMQTLKDFLRLSVVLQSVMVFG